MFKTIAALAFIGLACAAFIQPLQETIPNEFIVVMKDNITDSSRGVMTSKLQLGGHSVMRQFRIGKFSGFSVKVAEGVQAESFVSALEANPAVKYVVQNERVTIQQACNTQTLPNPTGLWGLDRIGKRTNTKDGRYYYDTTGAGVDVYIIDTGVYIQHQEFGGRAIWGETFTNDGDVDCNGHGTHCGSTAAGTQYGVAKGANIIAVKVLGCSGSGTWDGVIGGVAWTADRYLATGRPSVASMSLGGAKNVAVDDAVDAAIEAGVSFVVAAGNDNNDACRTSPAGVAAAITVGATETTDVRSTFSAWGTCVDIFAPGTNVLGAWIGSPTASRIISGTSMATPHVTGAVARYLQTNPTATPAQVTAALIAEGTPNILNLRCTTTGCQRSPNLLLYARCAGQE